MTTGARTCRLRAPAVSVGEELADDEDGGGEAEGGVSVPCSAVGVAAELAVVRPPRVGGCWFSTRDRIPVPVAVAPARERPHSAQWVGIWRTTWSGSATWARWVPGSPGC